MKIEVLSNFDFDKLTNKWKDKVRPYILSQVPKDAARTYKKILREKAFTPLQESTLNIRKTRRKKPIGSSTPLRDTGRFYKSIRANKRSVSHIAYGDFHNEDRTTPAGSLVPNKHVPKRLWKDKRYSIFTKKTKKRALSMIRKGLRRAGGNKIIGSF